MYLIFLLFLSVPLYALDVSELVSKIKTELLSQVILYLTLFFVPIILSLIGCVLLKTIQYITEHLKIKNFEKTISLINEKIKTIWQKEEVTIVKNIKEKSSDKKLTKEEGEEILQQAIKDLKNMLTGKEIEFIQKTYSQELEEFLKYKLEIINNWSKKNIPFI